MLRRLQHLPCEKLRDMALISLEKRQLHGEAMEAFNTYRTTEKIETGCLEVQGGKIGYSGH